MVEDHFSIAAYCSSFFVVQTCLQKEHKRMHACGWQFDILKPKVIIWFA